MAEALDAQEKGREAVKNYNYVVKCASLEHIRLLDVSFEVQPEFFGGEGKPSLSYDVSNEQSFFDAEKGSAFAVVAIDVSGRRSRHKVLACKAKYVVGYSGLSGCDEEAVNVFLRRVGPFSAYPYFRSLFANLDWSAGTQLPPLPIHKEVEQEVVPNPAPDPPKLAKRATGKGALSSPTGRKADL